MILDAQGGSRSIVRRFWDDLAWISDDFRPNFRRFSAEPLATKPQNRRLEKKSCDPRCPTFSICCVQSLRAARVSFEMAFEQCMFSFFSLRTHKPT